MAGVIRSDRLFTVPGVFLILASGFFAAIRGGFPILGTGWILWTLVLFGISGSCSAFGSPRCNVACTSRHRQPRAAPSTSSATIAWRGNGTCGVRWQRRLRRLGIRAMALKPAL